jgi:YD repeat-containing protein
MVDAAGTTKFTYTAGNQLLTEDGPYANDTLTNTYVNRLRSKLNLQQPTGMWTNAFTYDAARRLANVASPAGSFGYTFLSGGAFGLPIKVALPNTSYITNTYDNVARLTGTYLKNSSHTALDWYVYGYNPAGQRTNLTRTDSSTVAYTYDPIGQRSPACNSRLAYRIDAAGLRDYH